jgi:hypothetical protein
MNWERIKVSGGAMAPPDQKIVQLANQLGLNPELGPDHLLHALQRRIHLVMNIEQKLNGSFGCLSRAMWDVYSECEAVLNLDGLADSMILDKILGE